jgi:tetratricopeptide (TPR) repeat protein
VTFEPAKRVINSCGNDVLASNWARPRAVPGDLPRDGQRNGEAWALNFYAAAIAAADLPRAQALYRQSLAMNRDLNKPDDEAVAHEGLGECHLSLGENDPGSAHLHQALDIYERLGMTPDSDRVRSRLAELTPVGTGP